MCGCIYRWQSFQFRFQHKYAREKFAGALSPFGPLAVCLHYDPLKWLYGEGYETLTRRPKHHLLYAPPAISPKSF